jgi:hypothetical protein
LLFTELDKKIPHTIGEELHAVTMKPYPNITLAMPGRHQKDTPVPGGDFVVRATDGVKHWREHPFTHVDIFDDVEAKHKDFAAATKDFMFAYAQVVLGRDPDDFRTHDFVPALTGIHPMTFLHAAQCLAVAEHRRYSKHEARGGGRFLPLRFAMGISEGLWTAKDCKDQQRRGRPGLDHLIAQTGPLPVLTGGKYAW